MYKVKVENVCKCFLQKGMTDIQEFETKDEAKQEAESMIKIMQDSFCKKHEFSMSEQFGDFSIFIKPRN